jgi:hypothetical protein
MGLRLDVGVGEILTSASILISAFALTQQLSKDRAVRQTEQANEIRMAAARTLEGLLRWRELSLSLFWEAQPIYVQASVDLKRTRDNIAVRDELYSKLLGKYFGVGQEKRKEKILSAYIQMYKFSPVIKPYFETIIKRLEQADEDMLVDFLNSTQADVLDADPTIPNTAVLGNALRTTAKRVGADYELALIKILAEPEKFLSDLIILPDEMLLQRESTSPPNS